jgi:hypothetical protein
MSVYCALLFILGLSNLYSLISGCNFKIWTKLLIVAYVMSQITEAWKKRIVALGPKMSDCQLTIIAHNCKQPLSKAELNPDHQILGSPLLDFSIAAHKL